MSPPVSKPIHSYIIHKKTFMHPVKRTAQLAHPAARLNHYMCLTCDLWSQQRLSCHQHWSGNTVNTHRSMMRSFTSNHWGRLQCSHFSSHFFRERERGRGVEREREREGGVERERKREGEWEKEWETDRQTDSQTDRQTGKLTEWQVDKQRRNLFVGWLLNVPAKC